MNKNKHHVMFCVFSAGFFILNLGFFFHTPVSRSSDDYVESWCEDRKTTFCFRFQFWPPLLSAVFEKLMLVAVVFSWCGCSKVRCVVLQLGSLPAEIGQLRRLRVLFAYRNRLTEVPEELGACTQLEVLWILLKVLLLQIEILLISSLQ